MSETRTLQLWELDQLKESGDIIDYKYEENDGPHLVGASTTMKLVFKSGKVLEIKSTWCSRKCVEGSDLDLDLKDRSAPTGESDNSGK